jgi:hypothetical protein
LIDLDCCLLIFFFILSFLLFIHSLWYVNCAMIFCIKIQKMILFHHCYYFWLKTKLGVSPFLINYNLVRDGVYNIENKLRCKTSLCLHKYMCNKLSKIVLVLFWLLDVDFRWRKTVNMKCFYDNCKCTCPISNSRIVVIVFIS